MPPDDVAPVIELTGVRKRYRRSGPWVLDGVDLRVGAGHVVQIVGANGSGKSTLVRIAATLARPSTGSVIVRGPVRFVPELTPAPPPMTVRTYLTHQARLQGMAGERRLAAVDAVVDEHRLAPVADRPLRELSKGWGQRVVVAQALLDAPVAVVLDEPFSGVDRPSHEHLLAVIEEQARRGTTVLITSHESMAVVGLERLAIEGGRVAADGGAGRAAPVTRRVVVLRRRPGAPDLPTELQAHAAVERLEAIDGGEPPDALGVLLGADTADDFLARALDGGWSIERLDTRTDR